jgi:chromosome segregation ATPase
MPIAAITPELVAEIVASYPQLAALNLSSNQIQRLENLESLVNLSALDLRDNQLTSLEGIGGGQLPELRELNVSGNRIARVACGRSELLELLDLGGNSIAEWSQVEAIGAAFPRVRSLVLRGNPLCQTQGYRDAVRRCVPGLQTLDDEPLLPPDRTPATQPEPGPQEPHNAVQGREAAQEQLMEKEQALRDAEQQISRLTQKVGKLEASNFQVQERLEDAQMQVDEADERTTDAMVLKSEVEAANADLRREHDGTVAEKLKLEDALQQTTSQLQMLAAENQALQQKIDSHARAGQEQSTVSEEAAKLRRSLVAARQANNTLTDEAAQLGRELDLVRSQDRADASDASTQVAAMEKSVATARAAVAELEDANSLLGEQIKQLKRAVDERDAKLVSLTAEKESMQALLSTSSAESQLHEAALEKEKAVLQAKLDAAVSTSATDRADLTQARERLLRAEEMVADGQHHVAEATSGVQQENTLLKEQMAEAEMRASQVGEVLAVHEQSLADAERALENSKRCIAQNEDLKDENAALMTRLEELADAQGAAQAEVDRCRADTDAVRERLLESERNSQGHLVELAHAQAALAKMEDAHQQAMGDRQALQTEVESMQNELQAANNRASTAADELSVARTSLQGAAAALEESKAGAARVAELEAENSQLQMQLGQERDGLQHALQQLQEAERRAATVTQSLDTARTSLEGAEKFLEQSKQVVAEKSQLKRENEEMRAQWAAEREENERVRTKLQAGHQHGAAQLAEAEKHAVEAAAERRSLAMHLSEAQQSLASLMSENATLRAQAQAASESATINAVVEASQKSFQEAEKNLRTVVERSFEISEVREENARLQGLLARAQDESTALRSELSEADAKATMVNTVLDTTTTSLQSAELALLKSRDHSAQLAAVQQENDELERRLEAAVARCETCERAQTHHENESRAAKEEVSRLRWQEEELRKQIAAAAVTEEETKMLRQRLEQIERAGSEVNTVLDVTKASLEQAEKSLLNSKQRSSSVQAEMKSLEIALDQAQTERDNLEKELRAADSSRQQAQHKLTAANAASSRDRAELQQLRLHIARTPESPQPTALVAKDEAMNAADQARMAQELSLLGIRVDSMEQVLQLQEEELSNHGELISDATKQSATEQLLRSWRDKVLALLVQQKSTDMVHRQELAESERQQHQLRDEIAHLRSKLEILKQTEVNLKAESDRARNKQEYAEEMLQKATEAREEIATNVETERKQLGQLAMQVRTKYQEMEALETRLHASTTQLQGYSTRVERAAGRIGVAQGVVAQSLDHTRQDAERSAVERDLVQTETAMAQRQVADAEARAKELVQAKQDAEHAASIARDEAAAVRETAAAEVAQLNTSIESKLEQARRQASSELAAAQRQLQQVKREHSKSLVALRTLERQVSRGEETRVDETQERERQLTETLRRREEQLANLRAERNTLVATIRQARHEAALAGEGHRSDQRNADVERQSLMVDQGAQTAAVLNSDSMLGRGMPDRMRRLQEQEWWERRQLELEREIALLRDQQQTTASAATTAAATVVPLPPPPHPAAYEMDMDDPLYSGTTTSLRGSQMAAEAKLLAAQAAALELDREAALLELVSDTDSSFGSSDGSSGDSGYSPDGLRAHRVDSSDTDSDSDSDSSIATAPAHRPMAQAGLSREERLGQLSMLSSDLLADD